MKNLFVCGKKYLDTILVVDSVVLGETNKCSNVVKKNGGMYNLLEIEYKNWKINPMICGQKEAFIISDKGKSVRTSLVNDIDPSIFNKEQVDDIKNNCDWLHVCYVDDLECWENLNNFNVNYSLDFCTEKSRKKYESILNNAQVIFDSRERKHLYKNLLIKVPIVLHDENGFEIVLSGDIIHTEINIPLKNLNVNGAGDLFAGLFIENYFNLGLIESSRIAMKETTNMLRKRK